MKNNISTTYLIPDNFQIFKFKKDNLYNDLYHFFNYYNIITLIDKDIISSYTKDWSNLRGWADLVVIPKNKIECAIILQTCFNNNINITISAGKTNLTGSATPMVELYYQLTN